MKSLLEAIVGDGARTWDSVLWAGVGHGSELPTLRRAAVRQRILLEPHPGLFSRLASRVTPGVGERPLQVALWSGTGSRELHMVSNPVKSSLLPASGLLARLPNLRAVGTTPVWAMDLDSLVVEQGITGSDNLLILDIAGAEAQVLAAASREALGRFATILLAGADADDYEGAPPIAATVDRLLALGFDATARGAPGEVLLERNALAWELRSEQASLQERVRELSAQLEQLTARSADAEARLEAEERRRAAAEARRDELVAESDARLQTTIVNLAEREGEVASLQQQVEKLSADVKHLSEHASDIGRHRDSLAASEAALRARLAEAEAARDQALQHARTIEQQAEGTAAELQKVRGELAASARAAALATKLQMLREADLRDLQQRYEASVEVQARQHDMLRKLGERLSLASNYFHQLTAGSDRDEGGLGADTMAEPETAIDVVAATPAGRRPPAAKAAARKSAGKPVAAPAVRKRATKPGAAPATPAPASRPTARKAAPVPARGRRKD